MSPPEWRWIWPKPTALPSSSMVMPISAETPSWPLADQLDVAWWSATARSFRLDVAIGIAADAEQLVLDPAAADDLAAARRCG